MAREKSLVRKHLGLTRKPVIPAGEGYIIPNYSGVKSYSRENPEWEDLRFPFSGARLDSASGRLDYDFINGAVCFQPNARYPDEPISMVAQLPHSWKEGSQIRPHLHWHQQAVAEPNWLIGYRIYKNGEATSIDVDYSNYTFLTKVSNAFQYVSGTMMQITNFGMIDMTGVGLSDCIHFVLFRDTANTSGEFDGPETAETNAYTIEFDIHYQVNSMGSREEFVK